MNKWLSRTYWMIVGMLATTTALLLSNNITDSIWQSVVVLLVGAWIGNDLTVKIKTKP